MTAALRRRVRALERALGTSGGCNVIEYKLSEQPTDAIARARAAGLSGGYLVVPQRLTPEAWAPLARIQQANLLQGIFFNEPKGNHASLH